MSEQTIAAVNSLWESVQALPVEAQEQLASRIMTSLKARSTIPPAKPAMAEFLAGFLKDPVQISDDEVREIVTDELIKKYL